MHGGIDRAQRDPEQERAGADAGDSGVGELPQGHARLHEHVHGSRDVAGERGDRVERDRARHEDAARAGVEVPSRTGHRLGVAFGRVRVAADPERIGARIEVERGRGRRDRGDLGRGAIGIDESAVDIGVLDVHADDPEPGEAGGEGADLLRGRRRSPPRGRPSRGWTRR